MGVWEAGAGGPLDTTRFTTSWILPPSILFILRSLFSVFIFVSIFTILGIDTGTEREQYFSYFTSLTFFGLGFYFLFAALHTGTYWLTGRPLLERWPKTLQILHGVLYSTVTAFPFLVTIVYWAIIYTNLNGSFDIFRQVSQHVMNTCFALFEIFIPRTSPTPWIHLPFLVLILLLYLALAYVTYADQGFYVYDFLDDRIHSKGVVAGYIIGVLVITIIAFVLVHFLLLLRQWVTEKKMKMSGKFSSKDRSHGGAEHMEMVDVAGNKA